MPLARSLPLQPAPEMEASGAREAGLGSTVILLHVPFSHQAPIPSVFCRQRVRTHSGLHSECLAASADHPSAAGESGILLVRALVPVSRQWSCTRTIMYPRLVALPLPRAEFAGSLLYLRRYHQRGYLDDGYA
ncbi:hypothetical protein M431DRAFT_507843 [Trichoderma harzianum CBS 226.95]|uniref:Uncharacterized protein n=1 Tax=Trichoderma harzianum CBS 226.95 TaxID=983964 RepID=A0A2T4AGJ2_TRIHA|nr:hypothetical protein M431DRAFT_507843 [Trichoderma harzianum CBS 226.95]PTB56187.1 hypothetical protein M431DRAFT_507843 [Trichoderma harzianum CBS 226.95]